MKKMIFVMAILAMAVPAMAGVTVSITDLGSNVAQISYVSTDANVAAFGLNVTVDAGTITAVTPTFKGEGAGYGIFPSSFNAIIDPCNPNWSNASYSPVAVAGTPGALGGIGTAGVTLEMGTLYAAGGQPAKSGILGTVTVSGPCYMSLALNSTSGGIVLQNGTAAVDPILVGTQMGPSGPPVPGKAITPSPADAATGVSRAGVTLTWAAGSDATSHIVYFGTTSPGTLIGEQSGASYATGALVQGVQYFWRIDEKNDTGTTTGDVWSFRVEECLKNTLGTEYTDWVAWGRPSCWCYQRQCRGDINGLKNMQWVQLLDLNLLKAAFGKTDAQLATITNGICADINHTKNMQRVQLLDLNILKQYFGKSDSLVPVCDVAKVNFWTN